MEKVNTLWIGDAVTPTGFSRVNHEIIENLPRSDYDIDILAINYYGDPHDFPYLKIYPAYFGGDLYGYGRLSEMISRKRYDMIFILNDIWIISEYLKIIKETYEKLKQSLPKIFIYFPVDGGAYMKEFFNKFDIVTKTIVYTDFAKNVIHEAYPELDVEIIPHGINTKVFYPISKDKRVAKLKMFPDYDKFINSFIVLNANRNQPRKRLDLSLIAFAKFSKDKPDNVLYYHHAGVKDAGWNIAKLVVQLGIDGRIIMSNTTERIQTVSDDVLNNIYNSCDVGLQTSLGEGWGLTSVEHAVTKTAQIVPEHSACKELFSDCGLTIPTVADIRYEATNTIGSIIDVNKAADSLNELYENPDLRQELAEKAYKKFTSETYSWQRIGQVWDKLFKSYL